MAETKKKDTKKTNTKKTPVKKETVKKEENNTNNKKTITGLELPWEVVLVYVVGILGLIFAFMKNEKVCKEARFHYKQSGALFIISLAISIIYRILSGIFALIFITTAGLGIGSIIFSAIFGTIFGAFAIAVLVLIIITIIKAFNGEICRIPVVADIGEKIWKD